MRLRVIGSSPAWPNPGSAQSGYLVEGAGTLLLDCGPGVLGRLREGGELNVDSIAVTHFHLDHWGDLVPWAWLVAYGEERARHAELWLPPDGISQLATFASLWGNDRMFETAFELKEYAPGEPFVAAGYELEALPVPHYGLQAFGFRIHDRSSGALLAYSGDAAPSPELAQLAAGADLFLCEATLSDGEHDGPVRGHLSADEALEASDGPILLTHRPAELPAPNGVPLAWDGLVVPIEPRGSS